MRNWMAKEQKPFDGISFMYAFNDADAKDRRTEQLYELFGNRALYQNGWKAVTIHGKRMPWNTNSVSPFEHDVWELYDLRSDFFRSSQPRGQASRATRIHEATLGRTGLRGTGVSALWTTW